ncbi:hypothetical protein [Vibrio metschnikovii]|uniref:hypothetical protein n=1 Tax=Vibrio metschnikovii TaxID=28172 RepID=UPI001C30CD76|nr:hypothetical protein [Vibrio metschnikovii]
MSYKYHVAKAYALEGDVDSCVSSFFSVLDKEVKDNLCNSLKPSLKKNIVISGFPRTGKSYLSKKIQEKYNIYSISLDEIRRIYWDIDDYNFRLQIRLALITKIFTKYSSGILIEGDDLLSVNRSANEGVEPLTTSYLIMLHDLYGAKTYVIGNADCTVENKIKGMQSYASTANCWAVLSGEDNVKSIAKGSIDISRKLKKMFNGTGVEYIDLDPLNFKKCIGGFMETVS